MKSQRALVVVAVSAVSAVLCFLSTIGVKAEGSTHTDCADYVEAPVGVFVSTACLPTESWWPIHATWEKSLEGEGIDNSISSIFVSEGWSVFVTENPDGSGRTACLTETKWEMAGDVWSDGTGSMGDTISYTAVFEDTDCGAEEPSVEEPRTYCDGLSFAGVGLYDKTACETPGDNVVATSAGTLDLGNMSGRASSTYIEQGWSVMVSNGNGQEVCLFETKWDLLSDEWPNETPQGDTITSATVFSDSNCGYDELPTPEEPTITYCDSLLFVGVGFYDQAACQLPGYSVTAMVTGSVQFAGYTHWGASSVYVSPGWSVLASNGSEQFCLVGSKWNLALDTWPSGASQDNSITSAIAFANPACQGDTPPTEDPDNPVPAQYCSDHNFIGVGLYDHKSCEIPGGSVAVTATGTITLGNLTGLTSSAYISEGWSIRVSNGTEEACLFGGAKWDLSQDLWPSGTSQNDSITSAEAFSNATCTAQGGGTHPPAEDKPQQLYLPAIHGSETKTFCNDRAFQGVGLYASKSCELPGLALQAESPRSHSLSFSPLSIFVAQGWSVRISDGSNLSTCVTETKWDLSADTWPESSQKMSNIRTTVVYNTHECDN